jgi:hypothetical protein
MTVDALTSGAQRSILTLRAPEDRLFGALLSRAALRAG